MDKLEIIGVKQSTLVATVLIAAEEKNAPYTLIASPPHTDVVSAIHPFGKIPVMRHGDLTLFESRAILCYLDKAFPGPPLSPYELTAQVEQWVSLFLTEFDRTLVREYLLAYLFPGTPDGLPDRARIDAVWPRVQKCLVVLERALGGASHLVGGQFTIAEAYIAPMLNYLRETPEAGEMLSGSGILSGYVERLLARPSVKAALA